MHKIRVAVLRGGNGKGYNESLKAGATLLSHLPPSYQATDILVDKEGIWHQHGLPVDPHKALKHVDVAINATLDNFKDPSKIQHLVEMFKIPFVGSDSVASAVSKNKLLSKNILKNHGIKTPYLELADIEGSIEHQALRIFKSFPLPAVIKPVDVSGQEGVTIATNLKEIEDGLRNAYQYGDQVAIEEYIRGKEASCGVIDHFRGHAEYPMIPKHTHLDQKEKEAIQEAAKLVHKALNLRHYSQSHFVVHPRRGTYLVDVLSHPSLSKGSSLNDSLVEIGCSLPDFLEHIITLAMTKK